MESKLDQIISDSNNLISNLIHSIDKKILLSFNKELSRFNLSFQQAMIILYIAKHSGEKTYQKDIEIYMGLKNPSVTSLIKNLISNDFVYRIKDENDGRYYHLHLTPKSLAIKDDLIDSIQNMNVYIETILNEKEYKSFISSLVKINEKLKNIANQEDE